MLSLLLAIQIATVGGDAANAAPDTPAVLAAFKEVCWLVPHLERISERAESAGWRTLQNGKYPGADRLKVDIESDAKPSYRVQVRQFERAIGERRLLLTVNRGELTSPTASRGTTVCSIRDLSEPWPFDVATVRTWLGRPPNEVWHAQDGSLGHEWHSIGTTDPTIVQVVYVPPGSKLAGDEGLAGISLNAQAHGEHKR